MHFLPGFLNGPLPEAFGWMLVHSLWELTLLAAALAALLATMRRASAHARYLTALAGLMLMFAVPAATFLLLLPRTVPVQNTPLVMPGPIAAASAPITLSGALPPVPLQARVLAALRAALPTAETLYFLGLLLGALRLMLGYARLRALVHHAAPLAGAARERLGQLAARLRVRRTVALLESALVEVPTVVGFWRPVILVPLAGLTGLTPDQLSAILAHELAHIRRLDPLVLQLQTLLETLLFYHPALWWLSARVRQEREHACDDIAVQLTGKPLEYARALASLEHLRAAPRHTPAHLVATARGGALLQRIRRLLAAPPSPARPLSHAAAGLLVLTALATLLYAFGCAQQNRAVVAHASDASGKPEVLINVEILNVDDAFLAQNTIPPAAASATSSRLAVDALRKAMKEHSELISRPRILDNNGEPAKIAIGQMVPNITDPAHKPRFAGVQFEVLPTLSPDGQHVTLDFTLSVSAVVPGATTRIAGVGDPVPVLEERDTSSRVVIANGDTVMLGGQGVVGKKPGEPARSMIVFITASWNLSPQQMQQLRPGLVSQPVTATTNTTQRAPTISYRQLVNSNAADVARLVNRMFAATNGGGTNTGGGQVYADSDTRTNSVVLSGDPAQVKAALDMIQKIESIAVEDTATSVFFIKHLKNAKAADLAATLNARYGAPASAPATRAGSQPATAAQMLAGGAYFVANPDTNSLLVTCDKTKEEKIREEITTLDAAPGGEGADIRGGSPVTAPATAR